MEKQTHQIIKVPVPEKIGTVTISIPVDGICLDVSGYRNNPSIVISAPKGAKFQNREFFIARAGQDLPEIPMQYVGKFEGTVPQPHGTPLAAEMFVLELNPDEESTGAA